MKQETLDELIDRVAADMTNVRADVALIQRVGSQLDKRKRQFAGPLLATAAVLIVAFGAAVLQWSSRGDTRATEPARQSLIARDILPVAALHQAFTPRRAPGSAPGERRTSLSAGVATVTPRTVWVIDDSAATPALVVTELQVAPLNASPSPEIAPLAIEPLEVPELETVKDGSKESR